MLTHPRIEFNLNRNTENIYIDPKQQTPIFTRNGMSKDSIALCDTLQSHFPLYLILFGCLDAINFLQFLFHSLPLCLFISYFHSLTLSLSLDLKLCLANYVGIVMQSLTVIPIHWLWEKALILIAELESGANWTEQNTRALSAHNFNRDNSNRVKRERWFEREKKTGRERRANEEAKR